MSELEEITPAEAPVVEQMRLVLGYFSMARLLQVVVRLEIPQILAEGARSIESLAVQTGCHQPSLARAMRALASFGIFARKADGSYTNNGPANLLRPGVPGSLHRTAMLGGEPWFWRAFAALPQTLATGRTAFDHEFGTGLYRYFESHPEAADAFHQSVAESGWDRQVPRCFDFSRYTSVVDVGGGDGGFLTMLLAENERMTGVVFDQPAAGERAQKQIREAGLADRCRFQSGDFFETVPGGGDLYLLHNVLHNWPDAAVGKILATCAAAMPPDAHLLIIEPILLDQGDNASACFADISNLVLMGGRNRTETEYRAYLQEANLSPGTVTPVPGSPVTIIEATLGCQV